MRDHIVVHATHTFIMENPVAIRQARYFIENGNRLRQPSYVLLNASVKFTTANEKFSVTVFGRNLLNEDVRLWPSTLPTGDFNSFQKPATVGVMLGVKL